MMITGLVSVMSSTTATAAPAGATSSGATKPDIDLKQEDNRDLT